MLTTKFRDVSAGAIDYYFQRLKDPALCSNTRMEYKNNSVPLKPKTEFKFNKKEYKKIIKKNFERSNFSKIDIENFSTL